MGNDYSGKKRLNGQRKLKLSVSNYNGYRLHDKYGIRGKGT